MKKAGVVLASTLVLAGVAALLRRPPSPPPPSAMEEAPGRWMVSRKARDAYFADPARVNRDIRLRAVPGEGPDSVAELRVEHVAPDGPLWAAGLRPGDRVLDVDGAPVRSMSRAVGLVHEIRRAERVALRVERSGRPLDFFFAFR